MVQNVHIVSKAGIRPIVELESPSAVRYIRSGLEKVPTSSASMALSLVEAIGGMAAIAPLVSGSRQSLAMSIRE